MSVLLVVLAACSRTVTPGDAREVSGTIADWSGGTGTVQVEIFAHPLLETPVDDQGRFDITLPATLPEDKLHGFEDVNSFCGNELNSSTENLEINGMGPLGVTRDRVPRGQVAYQSSAKLPNGPAPVGTVIVLRFYVTKDVQLSGSCSMGMFTLDLNLKTGWNIVIAKVVEVTLGVPRLELSNGTIPADVSWYLFNY